MLSFKIAESGKFIQVDCDALGLDSLITLLEKYRASGGEGHLHLRAPSAGGNVLSETTPWGNDAVCEVIISMGGNDRSTKCSMAYTGKRRELGVVAIKVYREVLNACR